MNCAFHGTSESGFGGRMGDRAHAAVLESIECMERWEGSLSNFGCVSLAMRRVLLSGSSQERTQNPRSDNHTISLYIYHLHLQIIFIPIHQTQLLATTPLYMSLLWSLYLYQPQVFLALTGGKLPTSRRSCSGNWLCRRYL